MAVLTFSIPFVAEPSLLLLTLLQPLHKQLTYNPQIKRLHMHQPPGRRMRPTKQPMRLQLQTSMHMPEHKHQPPLLMIQPRLITLLLPQLLMLLLLQPCTLLQIHPTKLEVSFMNIVFIRGFLSCS